MKRNIILGFILPLTLLCSCSFEKEVGSNGGNPVPTATRGYIDVTVADEHTAADGSVLTDDIKTIRFFVFTDLNANPRKEVGTPRTVITEANRASALKAVFEVSRTQHGPNDKLVVAIANEPDALTDGLDAVTTPRELEALTLRLSDILAADHLSLLPGTQMPMTGAVWTDRDDVYATPGAALAAADRIDLLLDRAVARVDVYLTTDIAGGVDLLPASTVTLRNTFTESPFVRHEIGGRVLGKIQTVPSAAFAGNDKAWTPAPGRKNIPEPTPEAALTYVCSFYTPERYCRTDKLTLDIALATAEGAKSATVTIDKMYDKEGDAHDIDAVRRNNRYIVRGNIRKASFDAGVTVLPWNEGLEAFPLGQYRLTVDRSSLVFPSAGGTQTVAVTADHPDPWRIEKTENLPAGVTARKADDNTVEVKADPKAPGTPETSGWFTVRAGNLSKIIHVTQDAHYMLTVTKNEYKFTSISEMEQVLEISTDYPGGWEITPKLPEWPTWLNNGVSTWSAMSGEVNTTTSGNFWPDVYTADTDREFTFTVTAGPLSERITVKQRKNGYVFAAPGIPGIPMGQYRRMMIDRAHSGNWAKIGPGVGLTLRGSSTYKNTRVAPTATEFGGLHDDVVFTVYFLWGSTVAMVRDVSERWRGDGREVVWVNPGFTGSTVGAMNSPSAFGQATARSFNGDYDIADNAAKGHGDICGVLSNGTHRTPSGNPWQLADGSRPWSYNYTGGFKEANWQDPGIPAYYFDKIQDPADYVYTGYARSRIFALRNNSIFLPAAYRQTDGNFAGAGLYATYMTSTAYTAKDYYIIDLAPDRYQVDLIDVTKGSPIAYPVRCVAKAAK